MLAVVVATMSMGTGVARSYRQRVAAPGAAQHPYLQRMRWRPSAIASNAVSNRSVIRLRWSARSLEDSELRSSRTDMELAETAASCSLSAPPLGRGLFLLAMALAPCWAGGLVGFARHSEGFRATRSRSMGPSVREIGPSLMQSYL